MKRLQRLTKGGIDLQASIGSAEAAELQKTIAGLQRDQVKEFVEELSFYANGFEVESLVPGGDRMKVSGTSMASPQVANLAAKLLALDPSLTPAKLIALIGRGAEPSAQEKSIKLIHPARTVALLRGRAS